MVAQAFVFSVDGGTKVVIGGVNVENNVGIVVVSGGGPIVVIGSSSNPSHNNTSAEIRFLLAVNSGVSEARCEYKSEQCD